MAITMCTPKASAMALITIIATSWSWKSCVVTKR